MKNDHSDEVRRKVVVVTGANRGIGLATVERFISDGWWVCACVRSNAERLNNILYGHGQVFTLDLSDEKSVSACAKEISAGVEHIDALVNCAGMAHGALFSMTKMGDLREIFQINFFSQILFSQYISKKMIRKKEGAIVNVSSTSSLLADAGTLAYGSSKAAFSHATRIMATELGLFNIRVNAVAPAQVETDMGRLMDRSSADLLNQRASIKGDIQPSDVANLIYYLCSDESRYVTGQILRLDRGMPF